tara:strand:- start:512 stop:1123 length:612 start_codon:yes stop_codon:yes gene_type:complete
MKIIGLDFDNTLIDYDYLFYKTALDSELIPINITKSKVGVRNYLLNEGKEELFTILQGEVYGAKIKYANMSEGVMDALMNLKMNGFEFSIVSHKTKHPIVGKKYNLHDGALEWLKKNNFIGGGGLDIKIENIYFELTKDKKINRINLLNCRYFIDDLECILDLVNNDIIKIHYDRNSLKNFEKIDKNYFRINDWHNLKNLGLY